MADERAVQELIAHSVRIIKAGQDKSGAYLAGPLFLSYQYSWFRDGSFIADAMSRVGEIESAESFFDWAKAVITSRRDKIHAGEILHTRYTAAGEESNQAWANYQLDGFGTLVWAMYEHSARHNRPIESWRETIDLVIEYLEKRWQEPTHDWWEERSAVHPATLACIYAAFKKVGHGAAEEIRQTINLEVARLDASLIACATPFEAVTPEAFAPTLKEIEEKLVTPSGGVYRHLDDTYYGGGEWLLLTCFLGWHYARIGRIDDALEKLTRAMVHMDEEGNLPEQSSEHMLSPHRLQEWQAKWGPSAKPLLWSHAMFLTLSHELESAWKERSPER